jgi:hypothetical protein
MTAWPTRRPRPGPVLGMLDWLDLLSDDAERRDPVQQRLVAAGVPLVEVLRARVAHRRGGTVSTARIGAVTPYGQCPCPEHGGRGFVV